ncbi:MAG: glycosyltransferase [Pseudohongiellaceae bacterium]
MTAVLPLVSIVVRTVGRPELVEALESLAAQSHTNLETIIVDARGDGLPSLELGSDQRLVSTGSPLSRPKAANAGLSAVNGDFIMFLDDDDWVSETHIENLLHALSNNPAAIAAYSNTQRTSANGELLDEFFSREFDVAFLRRDNFMPIHSVLFRSRVLTAGCRVDESLDIYEDWDFWLQVAEHGSFYHVDKVTAFYRAGGDSETTVETEREKYEAKSLSAKWREKVLGKWAPTWSPAELNEVFGTFDSSDEIADLHKHLRLSQEEYQAALQQLGAEAEQARRELVASFDKERVETEKSTRSLIKEIESLQTSVDELRRGLENLTEENKNLSQYLTEVLNSFSWRVTKPYRYISRSVKSLVARSTAVPNNRVTAETPKSSSVNTAPTKRSSGNITCSVDSPGPDIQLVDGDLALAGWAFSAGSNIQISVSINERLYRTFEPNLPRDDVAASFRATAEARNSGFSETFEKRFLPQGRFSLTVTFDDGSDRVSLEREVVNFTRAKIYQLWLSDRQRVAAHQFERNPVESNRIVVMVLAEHHDAEVDAYITSLQTDSAVAAVVCMIASDHEPREYADAFLRSLSEAARSADALLIADRAERLAPHALKSLTALREHAGAELVYSDHDHLDSNGIQTNPEFTFGWSSEHLLGRNYIGGVYLFTTALFERINTEALLKSLSDVITNNPQTITTLRYRLLLELGNAARKVARVPEVLWSETSTPDTTHHTESLWASNFLEENEPGCKLLEHSPSDGSNPVRYVDRPLTTTPRVSIIIPTMAKLAVIEPCIETLLSLTDYPNFEVVMLDNSRGKNPEGILYLVEKGLTVIECDFDFNWPRLNNLGARESNGELLLFLNDDVEIIQASWLTELVKQAQRPAVGTVGALLYYPAGQLQHAGVFLIDSGGGGLHLFHKMLPGAELRGNLHNLAREVSANTGACLMVSREKFDAVDGFDESLAVVSNDVDLCLRLKQAGLINIWTPRCALVHHESISRKTHVPKEDEMRMWEKWGDVLRAGDEYYNPNLTLDGVDCRPELRLSTDVLKSADKADQSTASSVDAPPLKGVNLIGYIRAEMGLGEGARSDARALAAAEIEFGIINFERDNPARMGDLSWQHKECSEAPFSVTLWHINADYLPLARATIPAFLVERSYHIAYWAWELETMPVGWRPALDEVDEIWVPSEFVRQAIASETTKPVVCIPHCVAPSPVESLNRDYFGLPKEPFIFLAMYDTRSMAERKNPKAAIDAFIAAFDAEDERTTLVLKVNNATADSMIALREIIGTRRNIIIFTDDHSKSEIDSLINVVDCFVSLHRSEGFGLGPAEAMSLGKSVIVTNWSGSTDYTDPSHCIPIDYELITLAQDYGPYLKGQRWADPSLEQASAAMRKLVDEPDFAQELGTRARKFIEAEFSPLAVGQKIKSRLAEIN